jgi:hypothetical protein
VTYQLTPKELNSYERDGFLVRRAMFKKHELTILREAVERAASLAQELTATGRTYILDGKTFVDIGHITVQYEPESSTEAIRVIEPVHALDPTLSALVDNPKITDPMCSLLGNPSIALWTDKLNLKRPREGSGFGWHQDSPYWVHDSEHVDELHNVYLALDDANEENGCFRIIRGSHTHGCLPGTNDGTMLGGFYTDPKYFDISQEVVFDVSAGSLVFFHAHTVHGSQANQSDLPRRALIMTYQPAGHPMLKSGELHNTTGQSL